MSDQEKQNEGKAIDYGGIYRKVSELHGTLTKEVRDEMQNAIDTAWSSFDETVIQKQRLLFPNGKPTVEEFIATISKYVKTKSR